MDRSARRAGWILLAALIAALAVVVPDLVAEQPAESPDEQVEMSAAEAWRRLTPSTRALLRTRSQYIFRLDDGTIVDGYEPLRIREWAEKDYRDRLRRTRLMRGFKFTHPELLCRRIQTRNDLRHDRVAGGRAVLWRNGFRCSNPARYGYETRDAAEVHALKSQPDFPFGNPKEIANDGSMQEVWLNIAGEEVAPHPLLIATDPLPEMLHNTAAIRLLQDGPEYDVVSVDAIDGQVLLPLVENRRFFRDGTVRETEFILVPVESSAPVREIWINVIRGKHSSMIPHRFVHLRDVRMREQELLAAILAGECAIRHISPTDSGGRISQRLQVIDQTSLREELARRN